MKLAMFVGDKRHYAMEYIHGRHFVQTAERAGFPSTIAREALAEVAQETNSALRAIEGQIPPGFPEELHESVRSGLLSRAKISIRRLRDSNLNHAATSPVLRVDTHLSYLQA